MAEWKKHLARAIELKGSQQKLADAIGCSQSKINWLVTEADRISAEDALAIHRATDGEVNGSQLRPDLWLTPDDCPIKPRTPTEKRSATARA
jgi:DNA-binding transcriptional regulator YdaS (Cro superfamily)